MANTICYNAKKDYHHLEELIRSGKTVVCFVTYDFMSDMEGREPLMVTDIAVAKYNKCESDSRYDSMSVGCRGTRFFDFYPNTEMEHMKHPDFIRLCELVNLEYIEPDNNM